MTRLVEKNGYYFKECLGTNIHSIVVACKEGTVPMQNIVRCYEVEGKLMD